MAFPLTFQFVPNSVILSEGEVQFIGKHKISRKQSFAVHCSLSEEMGRRHVGKALLALTAGALVPFGSAEARDSTPTCEPIKTESGLEYCDFAVGQGEPAQPRTLIKVIRKVVFRN